MGSSNMCKEEPLIQNYWIQLYVRGGGGRGKREKILIKKDFSKFQISYCKHIPLVTHLEESLHSLFLGLHVTGLDEAHQLVEGLHVGYITQEGLNHVDKLGHVQGVLIKC